MSSPEIKPAVKEQPVKTIPSIRNIAEPETGHLDIKGTGCYLYAFFADLGVTMFAGRNTQKKEVECYYAFGGKDAINGTRYSKNEIMLEYWRRNRDAYYAACAEQDVLPMDLWTPAEQTEVTNG